MQKCWQSGSTLLHPDYVGVGSSAAAVHEFSAVTFICQHTNIHEL